MTVVYPVDEQPVDEVVPLVEVDGPHHCLEGVAVDMLLGEVPVAVRNHVAVQPDFAGDGVERLPRDNLRPQLGHEALVTLREFDVEVVRRHGLDDGIAQKFEPFVVDGRTVLQNKRS